MSRHPQFYKRVGPEMKEFEKALDCTLDKSMNWGIRLDGHKFSSFTKGFQKPYDARIANAMISTLADLMKEFNPICGYTCSDEITLIFTPPPTEAKNGKPMDQIIMYNGRVSKIASMIASFTSIKFNYYLMQEKYEGPKEENIKKKVDHMEAIFDGRLFALPKESDAVANLLWRQDWDCKRNSISMLAQKHFKPKEIHACSCATMKVMLKERKNIVWEDMPDHFKMGTFAKRGIVEVEGFNPRTKEKCWAKRKKVVTRTFELLKYNGGQEVDQGKLIFAKTWDEVDDLADEYKASTASDNTANVPTSDTTTSVPTSGTTTTATDDLPTETATGIIADTTPALAVAAAAQAISATDIAQADVASDVKRSSDTEDAAGEAVKKVKTRTDT